MTLEVTFAVLNLSNSRKVFVACNFNCLFTWQGDRQSHLLQMS